MNRLRYCIFFILLIIIVSLTGCIDDNSKQKVEFSLHIKFDTKINDNAIIKIPVKEIFTDTSIINEALKNGSINLIQEDEIKFIEIVTSGNISLRMYHEFSSEFDVLKYFPILLDSYFFAPEIAETNGEEYVFGITYIHLDFTQIVTFEFEFNSLSFSEGRQWVEKTTLNPGWNRISYETESNTP